MKVCKGGQGVSLGLLIVENDLAWSSGKDHGELCPQSGPWLGQGQVKADNGDFGGGRTIGN